MCTWAGSSIKDGGAGVADERGKGNIFQEPINDDCASAADANVNDDNINNDDDTMIIMS